MRGTETRSWSKKKERVEEDEVCELDPMSRSFVNVNTPEDYQTIQQLSG